MNKTTFKEKFKQNPSQLSIKYTPLPNSSKKYHQGNLHPSIQVPYREVSLSPTQLNGEIKPNPSIKLYDCSGPYTDPNQTINIQKGLPQHRKQWILDRKDVEKCDNFSSEFF